MRTVEELTREFEQRRQQAIGTRSVANAQLASIKKQHSIDLQRVQENLLAAHVDAAFAHSAADVERANDRVDDAQQEDTCEEDTCEDGFFTPRAGSEIWSAETQEPPTPVFTTAPHTPNRERSPEPVGRHVPAAQVCCQQQVDAEEWKQVVSKRTKKARVAQQAAEVQSHSRKATPQRRGARTGWKSGARIAKRSTQ